MKNTSVRNGRWTAWWEENGMRATAYGSGTVPGTNMDGLHYSEPLAARKAGRGLGARKRRMREARLARLDSVCRDRGWRPWR